MTESWITDDMRAAVGKVMRTCVSYPISASDIRRWAIAVYYPHTPPRLFWDEVYARTTPFGGIISPEEYNPFAWATASPSLDEPTVAQTAFSEVELGITPPKYKAMLMTEINTTYADLRFRPGDVAHSTHRISKYFEREGRMGHMLYTTVSQELTNQHGDWMRTTESVYVRY